jgi:hypothetical protein
MLSVNQFNKTPFESVHCTKHKVVSSDSGSGVRLRTFIKNVVAMNTYLFVLLEIEIFVGYSLELYGRRAVKTQ